MGQQLANLRCSRRRMIARHSARGGQTPGENTSLLVSGGPGMAGKKSTVNWNSLAIDESAGRTAQEDGHRREIFDYSKFTLKRVFLRSNGGAMAQWTPSLAFLSTLGRFH